LNIIRDSVQGNISKNIFQMIVKSPRSGTDFGMKPLDVHLFSWPRACQGKPWFRHSNPPARRFELSTVVAIGHPIETELDLPQLVVPLSKLVIPFLV
jgi:hypothetical protein